jgi:hypothetical protein
VAPCRPPDDLCPGPNGWACQRAAHAHGAFLCLSDVCWCRGRDEESGARQPGRVPHANGAWGGARRPYPWPRSGQSMRQGHGGAAGRGRNTGNVVAAPGKARTAFVFFGAGPVTCNRCRLRLPGAKCSPCAGRLPTRSERERLWEHSERADARFGAAAPSAARGPSTRRPACRCCRNAARPARRRAARRTTGARPARPRRRSPRASAMQRRGVVEWRGGRSPADRRNHPLAAPTPGSTDCCWPDLAALPSAQPCHPKQCGGRWGKGAARERCNPPKLPWL